MYAVAPIQNYVCKLKHFKIKFVSIRRTYHKKSLSERSEEFQAFQYNYIDVNLIIHVYILKVQTSTALYKLGEELFYNSQVATQGF